MRVSEISVRTAWGRLPLYYNRRAMRKITSIALGLIVALAALYAGASWVIMGQALSADAAAIERRPDDPAPVDRDAVPGPQRQPGLLEGEQLALVDHALLALAQLAPQRRQLELVLYSSQLVS